MKRNVRLLLCWYLSGFILGIIGANLLFRETGYSSGILAVYGTAASKEWIDAEALFSHLLFQRGIYFLSMIFLGLTYIGIFAVVLSLLWFGFLAGNLMTIFLLEYGVKGLVAGSVCFLPQIFFLFAGLAFVVLDCYAYEQEGYGQEEKGKGRLSSLYFLWCWCRDLCFIGDLAGKLC